MIFQCYICISVLNLWPFKKNACQYLYFKILLYKSQNADMSTKWRHYVIRLIFRCNICLSVLNLWTFKKNACKYLYFKMLLYISQNADMSAKWSHFCIKMSSYWFFNVTFVYHFSIFDHLKKTACQNLYFKISLYISQNADMSAKWRHFGINIWTRFFLITQMLTPPKSRKVFFAHNFFSG